MAEWILDHKLKNAFGNLDYNDAKEIAGAVDEWTLANVPIGSFTWIWTRKPGTWGLPPIILETGPGEYEVLDGKHRIGYARHLGMKDIEAYLGRALSANPGTATVKLYDIHGNYKKTVDATSVHEVDIGAYIYRAEKAGDPETVDKLKGRQARLRVKYEKYRKDIVERREALREIDEELRANRYRLNKDVFNGTLTLYHGTSPENAESILKGGRIEGFSFFSHARSLSAFGSEGAASYGKEVLKLLVDPRDVSFNGGSGEFEAENGLVRGDDGIWRSPTRVRVNPEVIGRRICSHCHKDMGPTAPLPEDTPPNLRNSHGICVECLRIHYPEHYERIRAKGNPMPKSHLIRLTEEEMRTIAKALQSSLHLGDTYFMFAPDMQRQDLEVGNGTLDAKRTKIAENLLEEPFNLEDNYPSDEDNYPSMGQ